MRIRCLAQEHNSMSPARARALAILTLFYYDMACVCSRSNARSDWLILVYRSPVITGKSLIINYLLTSNV